ncbi:EIN3-binding F box protein 1 [Hibiscus syriacus]|uniref:EIN3-binding F box protein 1 n=1 Tax=Hibiscus syriacus TaxID=106335 RepID=A0A6A3D084_HIBSY|nr:EIN3-binding F box protein 1 [Hibiscus syriacus]
MEAPSCYHKNKLTIAAIFVSSMLFCLSKPVVLGFSSYETGNFNEKEKLQVGSRPPRCVNKCSSCRPCMATLVIQPNDIKGDPKLQAMMNVTMISIITFPGNANAGIRFQRTQRKNKLLRSSSTPILCVPHGSAVAESGHRSKPITVTASSHNRMQRTPSDGNMRQTAIPKKNSPLSSTRSLGAHDSFKEEGADSVSSPTLSLAGGDVGSKGGAAQGFGDYREGKHMVDDYYQNMIET